MKTLFVILFAVAGSALAQTTAPSPPLAPELAPLAAKHKADFATIEKQRAAALAPYLPAYFTRLDAEEKNALNHGDIEAVAALRKEREALKAGRIGELVATPWPEKFPATLKPARDTLFDNYKRIDAQVTVARRKVDADYLRGLDGLQPQAAGKTALLAQIKAESDAVLGNPVTKPEGDVEVAAKTGKLINGDFSQADGDGFPVGWKLRYLNDTRPPPKGETFKVAQENNRSFLHTAFEQPSKGFQVVQEVDVPSYAREAELTLRMRGKLADEKEHRIVILDSVDASGKSAVSGPHIEGPNDTAWKTYSLKTKLDGGKTIKKLRILLESHQFMGGVTGYVDFSRVELKFR